MLLKELSQNEILRGGQRRQSFYSVLVLLPSNLDCFQVHPYTLK